MAFAVRRHDADALRVLREARDRDRAVRDRELRAPVEVEVGPARPPARVLLAERADESRPCVGVGEPRPCAVRRVELAARVRHEQVLESVAGVVADGDPHPRVRVVDVKLPSLLDEAEAERVPLAGSFTYSRFGSRSFAT